MEFCMNCKQKVEPKKEFRFRWWIVWSVLTGVGLILYPLYHVFVKKGQCPICNAKNWKGYAKGRGRGHSGGYGYCGSFSIPKKTK